MKKYISIIIVALISVYCIAAPQNHSRREQRQCKREQIESAKIAFFTTEIGITTEEAGEFWALYNKYSDERENARRAVRKAINELEDLTSSSSKSSDIEYKKAVKNFQTAFRAELSINELYYEEFYKVLSPEKVAKLVIAEDNFRKQMIRMFHGGAGRGDGA